MGNKLEIDSVQLSFREKSVLNGIYVEAETGNVTGILGRNGCGKSCLLKLIFGEIRNSEKSVRINGRGLYGDNRNPAEMRMLPQFNFLPKHLKVGQVFDYFGLDFRDFCEYFEEFGKWENLKIKALSGGTVRLLETFLILKSKTEFCILDEPFSCLSPKNISTFIDIIKQEKQNKGIIITDHMYRYITEVSDILYLIKDCTSYRINNIEDLKEFGYVN
ncbi:MAG: ATP-binding cassette domain-containing protein [Bacteroidales bacterium]|jgi:ABC-type multidrug transport system ATPase subunit|nr:ATP-binding cassette domain-containing protein [Bacteroidales bacterium]